MVALKVSDAEAFVIGFWLWPCTARILKAPVPETPPGGLSIAIETTADPW